MDFHARTCIWEEVSQHLTASLLSELKTVIGESIVDETFELHKEVQQLHDIYHSLECQESKSNSGVDAQPCLPEPPQQRAILHREINIFLEVICRHRKQSKSDALKGLCGEEKAYIFLRDITDGWAVQQSATGIEQYQMDSPRVGNLLEMAKSLESSDSNQLEILALQLREHLTAEQKTLLQDVSYLQQCILQTSVDHGKTPTQSTRPTIKELRRLGTMLEQEVLLLHSISRDEQKSLTQDDRRRSCSSAPVRHIPSPPSTLAPSQNATSSGARNYRRYVNGRAISVPSLRENTVTCRVPPETSDFTGHTTSDIQRSFHDQGFPATKPLPKIV